MTKYSVDFLKKMLALAMKDGEKFNPGQPRTVEPLTNLNAEQEERYQKSIERNAEHAEKILGVPHGLWIEATRALRAQFGYEKMFEALFLAGFTLGWVERGVAEKCGERLEKKR